MILSGKICTFQIITGTKNKDELHLHENKTKSEDLVRAPEAGAWTLVSLCHWHPRAGDPHVWESGRHPDPRARPRWRNWDRATEETWCGSWWQVHLLQCPCLQLCWVLLYTSNSGANSTAPSAQQALWYVYQWCLSAATRVLLLIISGNQLDWYCQIDIVVCNVFFWRCCRQCFFARVFVWVVVIIYWTPLCNYEEINIGAFSANK